MPTSTLSPTSTPAAATPVPTVEISEDLIQILLIGGDAHHIKDINTDTLIVVVVDRKARQVSLLSIPRDLWVQIPGHGWTRINRAYRLGNAYEYPGGGPALLSRTIEENLGIPVDHWVRVQVDGFKAVVDALGGVDMVVPCSVRIGYKHPEKGEVVQMDLQPGVHHLDGETALQYVRSRLDDGVYGRARRNQQFLKAIWDQTRDTDLVTKIPALWSALRENFETDLSLPQILALVPTALDLEEERVRSLYLGLGQAEPWTTPEGWWVLVPDPDKVRQLVDRLYAPLAEDEPGEEAARVQVQNGTHRSQLALIAADQLHWEGFEVIEPGPADHPEYQKTQVIVYRDRPQDLALLARLLEVGEENVVQQSDVGRPYDFQVILGEDYDPCR